MTTPLLVVTMGDPAGIGPEVLAKYLASIAEVSQPLLLVGSQASLVRGAAVAGVELPSIHKLPVPSAAALEKPVALDLGPGVWLYDLGPLPADFQFGQVQAACGQLAVQAVELAARLCISNSAGAMVTCPINKEAIHAAGYVDDIGHQEILARLTGAQWTATMLMTPGLRVVHLSTHKSLAQAVSYIRRDVVLEKLQLTQETFERWGLPNPRIAVAGVNPHNGEGGLLGAEEIEQIAPAVVAAQALKINASGPIPADSVFNRAINGEFDVVLAMYHDQGHIAIKVHDFHHSTTATLGIPFIRTSVDHGTAFDIAGQGRADATGLAAAISTATALVQGDLASL
jgi:4-hydroxythreonine-4-phosphate dehydrogenase